MVFFHSHWLFKKIICSLSHNDSKDFTESTNSREHSLRFRSYMNSMDKKVFFFFFHRLLRSIQYALIQDATSCDCGEAQTALTYTGCLYTALCLISFGSLQNSKSTWAHSKSHFRCARHKYLLHKQKCFPLTGTKIFCSVFYSSIQSTSISTKKQIGKQNYTLNVSEIWSDWKFINFRQ